MTKAARELNYFNSIIKGSAILAMCFVISGCKNIFSGSEDAKSEADIGFAPGLDPAPKAFSIIDTLASFGKVKLTWQNSENSLSYNLLYRKQGDPAFTRLDGVTSPYTLLGLGSFIYEFQVEAINERGATLSGARTVSLMSNPGTTAGFATASSQLSHTASGRIVQGSMDGLTDQIKMVTTPHGYKVYSNIQGQLLRGTGGSN